MGISFDRYRVMVLVADDLDKVGKREHSLLVKQGNEILEGEQTPLAVE